MSRKVVVIGLAVVFALGVVAVSFMGIGATNVADPGAQAVGDAFSSRGPAPSIEIDPKKLPQVVAVVNGTEISRDIFVRSLSSIKNEMERTGQALTKENLDGIQKNMLDTIINTELLYQESEAGKIKVDDESVMKQFAEIKSRFPSEEEFNKKLAHEFYSQEELKAEIRKGKMITVLLEQDVYSRVSVSEKDARQYYDENGEMFRQPETVKARHILIKLTKDADEETTKKAEALIEEITEKQKGGESFEDLAKQYSEGPSAPQGGDLGYFPRGMMVKEFDDAVFSMKPGEVSGVVRTQFGLHLIKLEEVREAGIMDFEQVKERVIESLKMIQRRKVVETYISDLRKKADIKTFI
jgi:peptidyl-prolyl cis-trans isomerase C